MSPQVENGYTRIANELMEILAKLSLNGTQYKIILVVFRYTYGFQRKNHELSLTFISKATGSHKVVIQREVANLIKMNILTEISAPTFSKGRVIGFNKDYSSWELTNQLTGNQLDNHTVNQSVNSTVNQSVNQERKKENLKESIVDEVVKLYKDKLSKLPQPIKITAKRKASINARIKEYSLDEVKEVISIVANSPFLTGNNDRNWKADIDWIFNASNFIKIKELKYNIKEDIPMKKEKQTTGQKANYVGYEEEYGELR